MTQVRIRAINRHTLERPTQSQSFGLFSICRIIKANQTAKTHKTILTQFNAMNAHYGAARLGLINYCN